MKLKIIKNLNEKIEKLFGKKKKYLLIGILFLFIFGTTTAVAVKVIKDKEKGNKNENKDDEELVLYWELPEVIMNIGENKIIRYVSNRNIVPYISCEGTSLIIENVNDKEVRIKAVFPGFDNVTIQAENCTAICIVKVNDDIFKFENDETVLGVGVSETYFIKAEPKELLEISRINYSIENREIAKIKEVSNEYIEILGLKKGITYINAEWRGKSTGFVLEVVEDLYRQIKVPKEKQYVFVGQETKIEVRLDEQERGDEYNFRISVEPKKDNISATGENNIVRIRAVREGEQYVKVTHPKARSPGYIYFDVLKQPELESPRIETSESPMILRKDQVKYLNMYVLNGVLGDEDKFSFEIIENAYGVRVEQKRNKLLVAGIAPCAAKIRISNETVTKPYEVMVIVE